MYLDNSAFERKHNGGSIDEQKFIDFAKSIENDNLYVMIPDYFNDSEKTLESAKLYGNFNHNIFIPHGKNYDDYMLNAEKIVKLMDTKNDIIAVNFCDGVFENNKRYKIIKSLKNIGDLRIHVLGLKHPNEVCELKEIKDIIFKINQKRGNYYSDSQTWESICRVERGKVTNRMRFSIYQRDHYRCQKCGRRTNDLEVDHIIPISKGGKSTYDNLQTLCHRCNVRKGAKIE